MYGSRNCLYKKIWKKCLSIHKFFFFWQKFSFIIYFLIGSRNWCSYKKHGKKCLSIHKFTWHKFSFIISFNKKQMIPLIVKILKLMFVQKIFNFYLREYYTTLTNNFKLILLKQWGSFIIIFLAIFFSFFFNKKRLRQENCSKRISLTTYIKML